MHGFSTADGFVEITESLAEMIKYVANEPSVGLFYIQQHTQNAVPNVVHLKNTVVEKSWETNLHTEDLEDSITMVRSMKECGFPLADDMVSDIRKSLTLMSTRQPRRGLISNRSSGFLSGRTRPWGPASWGHNGAFHQQDAKGSSSYFSSVIRTAREKASNFKWQQPDASEITPCKGEDFVSDPTPLQSVASASTSTSQPDIDTDELPVSSQATDELRMHDEEDESGTKEQSDGNLYVGEYYDDFKANREAKLKEWLGEDGNDVHKIEESK